MIDKICTFLTNRIRKEMPEIDEQRAEIIYYGLQNIVGEIPKIFIMLAIAYLLGIFKWALFTFLALFPYKGASGGVHLKTHLGCFICTNIVYCGNALISTIFNFPSEMYKYITAIAIWIFGVIMVSIYAPADTENLPILTKKERKIKKILSYIFLTINMIVAIFIKNNIIANILIFGTIIQTISITRIAYNITKNKYGYETYLKEQM